MNAPLRPEMSAGVVATLTVAFVVLVTSASGVTSSEGSPAGADVQIFVRSAPIIAPYRTVAQPPPAGQPFEAAEPGPASQSEPAAASGAPVKRVPTLESPGESPGESVARPDVAATPEPVQEAAPIVVRSGAEVSADDPVGDPLAISIPAIGVYSSLVPAGYLADGSVAVPPDPFVAGWFSGGPRPGERGPAVIMGHVDSKRSGPGVFWHLIDLPIGAVVTVETTTGPQQFVVQSVEQFPKDNFPTERIYGSVPQPVLRLITCGGSFDRSSGHYRDNVVAFLGPVTE